MTTEQQVRTPPKGRSFFSLSIGLFLAFTSGLVLLTLLFLGRLGLENIDTIARLATDIEQHSLPEILQNQRTFILIESLRRNAQEVYIAEDASLRRNARLNAHAMAAEAVFDMDPNFSNAIQRIASMITALAGLKDHLQAVRNELFNTYNEFTDFFRGVQVAAGMDANPALEGLHRTRALFLDAKTEAAPPLSGEQSVKMDALCRSMAGNNIEMFFQTARCDHIKGLLEQYTARYTHYQQQRAETEAKWRELDGSIRELRDTISTSSETATTQSLAAIKTSALVTHDQTVYIFGGCILAIFFYLLLLHRMIVRPLRWTTKKLGEIQQGDLHMTMPVIHIRELAEVAELLDRFSSRLSELYTHTSQLEEDSAGKRDLEEIMRALFQVAPDGYTIWDEDRIISASPGFMNLLGVSSLKELIAHSAQLGLLYTSAKAHRDAFVQGIAEGILRTECVYTTLNGEPRPCEVTRMRIDLRGKPVLLSYVRDMRNQKRTEEILRQAKEQAEVSTMAKSEFLARMSHEIRTPMNGVLGLTHIALSHDPPPLQRQYLNKIQASAKILLGVLNDILDFSKIESGKLLLESAPFSVDNMLTALTDLLQSQAEAKNLTFVLERDPDVPRALLGDDLRLSQVLLNLCGNALKFTEKGRVTLRISHVQEEPADSPENTPAARLHFAIADTGVGMSPEQLSGLFKPFAQADVSTTRKYGGTGLGLAISKLLVELMDGRLEVVSTPGQGSCFSFTITFALPPAEFMEPEPKAQEMEEDGLRGRRVLLVEDNEINREIATALLEELGVNALVAVNGQQALTMLETEDVDGVLMDIQMPVMDGLTATQILRKEGRPLVRALPVIAMTAHAMQADRDKSIAAGMDDHITKPIDIAVLKSKLVHWIGGNAASG